MLKTFWLPYDSVSVYLIFQNMLMYYTVNCFSITRFCVIHAVRDKCRNRRYFAGVLSSLSFTKAALTMTTAAERKFVNLRKRLDQLGYRQPLGVESLPLVEKLFRYSKRDSLLIKKK